ncbi:MAG: glycoside hydrolase family 13 protein [Streptococcaceae bacterium]|nr:glycoside hydrolase family 13 protein [Streptococcaceae bacterium]
MQIYYNSWLESFKRPFGAVKVGNKVKFKILVEAKGQTKVQLVIRKENESYGKEYHEMRCVNEKYYELTYLLSEKQGLYFYYFKVINDNEHSFTTLVYASNGGCGGEGRIYNDSSEATPFSLTCYTKDETPPKWYRDAVFYQIFPDRFFNGDYHLMENNQKRNVFFYGKTSDEPLYIKDSAGDIVRWDFYGGNLAGIIEKIPYLKNELGVTAIYLNPIFEAFSNHRYDTADFKKIDSLLGDEATFKKLVNTLHENDMQIVLDGVFSHVGRRSKYFNADASFGANIGAAQTKDSPYYPWFKFINYPNDYNSWWGIKDLPEIDKNNPQYQEYIFGDINSVLAKWNSFNIDGWRLDVADELPDDFIRGIRANLETHPDKILIGEVWEDASRKIAYDERREYILGNALHACMNYPFRSIIIDYLNQTSTAEDTAKALTVFQENYPSEVFYNNFNNIGSHDTERIFTVLGEDVKKLDLAVAMLSVLPGVPCYYYGDEKGLTGEKDPDNRKFFPWQTANTAIFDSFKFWIKQRKENDVIRHGKFVVFHFQSLFGIMRYTQDELFVYLVNNSDDMVEIDTSELIFTRECPISEEELKQLLNHQALEGRSNKWLRHDLKL